MVSDEEYEKAIGIVAAFHRVSVDVAKSRLIGRSPGLDVVGETYPTETYSEARKARGENIVAFLERVWRPFIEAKTISLNAMRVIDVSVIDAINNYERADKTGVKKRIPDHLKLPKARAVAAKVYGLEDNEGHPYPSGMPRKSSRPKLITRDVTLMRLSRKLTILTITSNFMVALLASHA